MKLRHGVFLNQFNCDLNVGAQHVSAAYSQLLTYCEGLEMVVESMNGLFRVNYCKLLCCLHEISDHKHLTQTLQRAIINVRETISGQIFLSGLGGFWPV